MTLVFKRYTGVSERGHSLAEDKDKLARAFDDVCGERPTHSVGWWGSGLVNTCGWRASGDATQGGVNVRQQGWLGFTLPAYVSEGSDKTRTNVRLLYKERRVQVFYSDINIFRALEDTKLL